MTDEVDTAEKVPDTDAEKVPDTDAEKVPDTDAEKVPEAESVESKESPWQLVGLIAGCVLFVVGVAGLALLDGSPGEFGYSPFAPDPLPFAAMRGFTFEQLLGHVVRILIATPALLLVWRVVRSGKSMKPLSQQLLDRIALVASTASVGMILYLILFVFRGRAIVDDEQTYRMQAAILRDGQLGIHGLPYMQEVFTIPTRVGFTGKYLFGEPLLQVPGLLLGYPALSHAPLAALTLFALHRAVRKLADAEIAAWAVILVACSPLFIFTTATAQSQAGALACVALAALGYTNIVTGGSAVLGALLMGASLGFGTTVRIQVGLPVAAILLSITAVVLFKRRAFAALAVLCASFGAFIGLIGAYNYVLSGSPLKLPWFLATAPEHYGFGAVWDHYRFDHNLRTLLENLGVVAVRFNAWWLGWPSSLLLLWLWFRSGKKTEGARPYLWIGLAVLLFEAAYYSTGISDTGPIYHYELLLPAALLGANAIREGFRRNPRVMTTLLVVQFGLGWTSFMWFQEDRIERLLAHIHDDVDAALEGIKGRALVLYESRCPEAVARGWVHEPLPIRFHSDRDRIVAYRRPQPRYLAAYVRRYADRDCYYFRLDPTTHAPTVVPCMQAIPELKRAIIDKKDQCLWDAPTATRLGLYDPWPYIKSHVIKRIDSGDPLSQESGESGIQDVAPAATDPAPADPAPAASAP